jgi:hypothetical protein
VKMMQNFLITVGGVIGLAIAGYAIKCFIISQSVWWL